ncbi:MAG: MoaD/ThiS family protein [Rhodoferax sp.]|nr:MoaD/ThiS family protein [Rhodoferax sp.]
MQVHIKYFASIREALGRSSETWNTSALTLGDLRLALVRRDALENHPLAAGRAVRIALNQLMCEESAEIVEGAEVAFFPPVTGG